MSRKIFISVGETSGDAHGANLMKAIREIAPDVEFRGLGGPLMAEAGCRCITDATAKSGMWVRHIVQNYFHYRRLFYKAIETFDADRPDGLVLIDHPIFNVALARKAKERGIPVIYYICPQTWAWGSWRIKKMARRIDKMLVILPFERAFWQRFGVEAEYVGHPAFDHLCMEDVPPKVSSGPSLVGLLPGSRMNEIKNLFPIMLKAAEVLHQEFPDVRFRAVCARKDHVGPMREMAGGSGLVEIEAGDPHELMKAAMLCMVTSGTTTLELAYFRTPMVVLYRIIWFGRLVCPIFVNTDRISLVNLLADKEIVPELCMFSDNYRAVAEKTARLLRDESRRRACADELDKLCREVAHPGASARAAKAVLQFLDNAGSS
ncbi:MAG: lipid-A-disaccharide synthase [Planctomycetota bacterium]